MPKKKKVRYNYHWSESYPPGGKLTYPTKREKEQHRHKRGPHGFVEPGGGSPKTARNPFRTQLRCPPRHHFPRWGERDLQMVFRYHLCTLGPAWRKLGEGFLVKSWNPNTQTFEKVGESFLWGGDLWKMFRWSFFPDIFWDLNRLC